jgi:hypothetical protein
MMWDREKGLSVINQALPNDYCQTHRPHAAATGEIGGGPVSSDAACALLRWENEGGSALLSQGLPFAKRPLVGTTSQIEWAESIRTRVNDEFDRVAKSFRSLRSDRMRPKEAIRKLYSRSSMTSALKY